MDNLPVLSAPFYSFFSRSFYRKAVEAPLKKGFLYLGYLTVLAAVLVFAVFRLRVLPEIDRFAVWMEDSMPQLTWTPEGLAMNARSPYAMIHEQFGPLVTFDMTRDEVSAEEIGDALIFVTSRRAYVRHGAAEVRVYDLTQPAENRSPEHLVVSIDREFLKKFYGSLKPWLIFLSMLFFVPSFFLWKLFEALLYSLAALVLQAIRKTNLPYRRLFGLCLFAMTPATLIQFRGVFAPPLAVLPFGIFGSMVVTSAYLYLALCQAKGPSPAPQA